MRKSLLSTKQTSCCTGQSQQFFIRCCCYSVFRFLGICLPPVLIVASCQRFAKHDVECWITIAIQKKTKSLEFHIFFFSMLVFSVNQRSQGDGKLCVKSRDSFGSLSLHFRWDCLPLLPREDGYAVNTRHVAFIVSETWHFSYPWLTDGFGENCICILVCMGIRHWFFFCWLFPVHVTRVYHRQHL